MSQSEEGILGRGANQRIFFEEPIREVQFWKEPIKEFVLPSNQLTFFSYFFFPPDQQYRRLQKIIVRFQKKWTSQRPFLP